MVDAEVRADVAEVVGEGRFAQFGWLVVKVAIRIGELLIGPFPRLILAGAEGDGEGDGAIRPSG